MTIENVLWCRHCKDAGNLIESPGKFEFRTLTSEIVKYPLQQVKTSTRFPFGLLLKELARLSSYSYGQVPETFKHLWRAVYLIENSG